MFFFCCASLLPVPRIASPSSAFCMLAVFLSLFIILFMVLVPKAPPGGYSDPTVYDHTSKFRTGIAAILGISALVTLVLMCGQVFLQPIQGSRIRPM